MLNLHWPISRLVYSNLDEPVLLTQCVVLVDVIMTLCEWSSKQGLAFHF